MNINVDRLISLVVDKCVNNLDREFSENWQTMYSELQGIADLLSVVDENLGSRFMDIIFRDCDESREELGYEYQVRLDVWYDESWDREENSEEDIPRPKPEECDKYPAYVKLLTEKLHNLLDTYKDQLFH